MNKFLFLCFSLLFISCNSEIPNEKLDHIILIIDNLENGMTQFEELTGVSPVFGGVHGNGVTQNALVALNDGVYLEILAPRDALDSVPEPFSHYKNLTAHGWAVATKNAELTKEKLLDSGFDTSGLNSGSRNTPQGNLLSWSTFFITNDSSSVFPFFIQWGVDSVHPSSTTPKGCELKKLQLFSKNKSVIKLTELLHLNTDIIIGEEEKITVEIESPKGLVVFSGVQ